MTTRLRKMCSFGLPRVPSVNCCHVCVFSYFFFVFFKGRIWDLILSVPDHCLSFYFSVRFCFPLQLSMMLLRKNLLNYSKLSSTLILRTLGGTT